MKKIVIIISIALIFLIGLIMFFYPNIRRQHQINDLSKEIKMVNKYLYTEEDEINKIRDFIKKEVAPYDFGKLEKEIDLYLTDIINAYENAKVIMKENQFDNLNIISKDELSSKIENNNHILYELELAKSELDKIDVDNYITEKDKTIYKLLQEKIDTKKIISNIDSYLNDINKYRQILDFLNNNIDYWDYTDRIIINKRSIYNDFENLISELNIPFDFKLIDDNIGPVINASNIVISEGDNINVANHVSCTDEVDGNVDCKISGSVDNQKAGTYPVVIKSADLSNNISEVTINVIVKEKEKYNLPYVIEVIRNQSTTIVYGKDDNGEYTKIVGVFPCSPGAGDNTPIGTFYSRRGFEWGALFGNVYGQYSTVITGHVLFHSVPYYSMKKNDLIWEYYNKLGTKVSMGCIRLTVRDAKWIYDNCPNGTMVKIYDGNLPDGVSKPSAQKIDGSDSRRGWDPTDPDPANPWKE